MALSVMSLAGISAAQVPRSRGWKESSERGGRLAGALRATVSRERERKYSYALFCCCTLLFSILALHDHHNNSNSHARPRPASRVPLRSLIHLTSPRSESRKPSPQEIHVPHQKSPLTCERERERERKREREKESPLEVSESCPSTDRLSQSNISIAQPLPARNNHRTSTSALSASSILQESHLNHNRNYHNTPQQHNNTPWVPHSLAPWPRSSAARKCAC